MLVTINAKVDGGKAGGKKGKEEIILKGGKGPKGNPGAAGDLGGGDGHHYQHQHHL